MLILFTTNCQLETVEALDGDGEPIWGNEVFAKGDIVEIDLIDHPVRLVQGEWQPDPSLWNVQFPNGTMAMGVSRKWFDILP